MIEGKKNLGAHHETTRCFDSFFWYDSVDHVLDMV